MAKVTFLIGNGFDLNCGLNTRFTDMYPSYIQTTSKNKIIEEFKKDIKEAETLHFERWSDFELGMAHYAEKWKNEDEMLICLEDFTNHMIQFISEEQKQFSNKMDERSRHYAKTELINSIKTFYKALPHNDPVRRMDALLKSGIIEINFLVFNYTSIFDGLLSAALANADTAHMQTKYHDPIHIHGTLRGPVLGVDNEQQLQSICFPLSVFGKRAFIKPYYNQEFDFTRLQLSLDIIHNSDIICVYGKRLGATDQMWNQALLVWLAEDSAHELVYYDHTASQYISNIAWRRMNLEDTIKNRLINELRGEKDIFSQIHIPIGTNIFNISRVFEA